MKRKHRIKHILYFFLLASFLIASCSGIHERKARRKGPGIIMTESKAGRFILEEYDSYTRLTIVDPWQGVEGVQQVWYLVPTGSPEPGNAEPGQVISVPVKKIVCMSSTHLAMITALGREASIVGVSGAEFLYDPVLINRYEEGLIKDVGYEDNLNKELILDLGPDLVMTYGIGGESTAYMAKLGELGIKVMYNADYLESDPLSKAEWIKLFGALYCSVEQADSIFMSITGEYARLRSFIHRNSTARPNVMLGLPFKDTWYISPGNSYISKLISDAGGNYLWKDATSSVSMPLGIENVYVKAIGADVWLNPGNASSKAEIIAVDPRLATLPCFINDAVYNNNNKITSRGANDYWESGTINPHILLRDIASILHPELMTDTSLVYYKKIE